MATTVPMLSTVFIVLDALLGIAIPIILLIFFRKKYGGDLKMFFVGCMIMLVFSFILEDLINVYVLGSAWGTQLMQRTVQYAIYGGFMAGLFEETGRFMAFKILKGSRNNDKNAFVYGIGHGGLEMFVLLTVGMGTNLIYISLINGGGIDQFLSSLTGAQMTSAQSVVTTLVSTPSYMFLVSPIERIAAITAQIALSVIVWFAVKQGGRALLLYPFAIVLHMVLDACSLIVNHYAANTFVTELFIYAFTALIVFIAVRVWKKYHTAEADQVLADVKG